MGVVSMGSVSPPGGDRQRLVRHNESADASNISAFLPEDVSSLSCVESIGGEGVGNDASDNNSRCPALAQLLSLAEAAHAADVAAVAPPWLSGGVFGSSR